jgi:hypothetical protein
MDELKDSIPEETWVALQALEDAFPEETGVVLAYLAAVTNELAGIIQFLCERSETEERRSTGEQIERACSLLGQEGERLLADCSLGGRQRNSDQ